MKVSLFVYFFVLNVGAILINYCVEILETLTLETVTSY